MEAITRLFFRLIVAKVDDPDRLDWSDAWLFTQDETETKRIASIMNVMVMMITTVTAMINEDVLPPKPA